MTDSNLITDEEEFHSSYRIFINAVEMLAATPEAQCEAMGNFNVAWELKEDVTAGQYLVKRGYLSEEQEAWIEALVGALSIVNTSILPAGASKESNTAAMSSPRWEPARFMAKTVLERLHD
ncbi:MAG TPA: hypothetical protein PLW81_10750 [Thiobacillaceae bacterium]|nr:hypothetical protein [Thiobacillaceae bacterium]